MLLLVGCASDPQGPVLFAAASTQVALEEVLADWAGPPVRSSYAASSLLARQIEAGAPADVFLSAHPEWLPQGQPFLRNTLVLVGAPLEQGGCTLVADEHVPAGRYAREVLSEDLVSAPDAPATRRMYDQGLCPRAALYRTDAGELEGDALPTSAVVYPMAALTPEGEDLEAWLREQHPRFEAHGFH